MKKDEKRPRKNGVAGFAPLPSVFHTLSHKPSVVIRPFGKCLCWSAEVADTRILFAKRVLLLAPTLIVLTEHAKAPGDEERGILFWSFWCAFVFFLLLASTTLLSPT